VFLFVRVKIKMKMENSYRLLKNVYYVIRHQRWRSKVEIKLAKLAKV